MANIRCFACRFDLASEAFAMCHTVDSSANSLISVRHVLVVNNMTLLPESSACFGSVAELSCLLEPASLPICCLARQHCCKTPANQSVEDLLFIAMQTSRHMKSCACEQSNLKPCIHNSLNTPCRWKRHSGTLIGAYKSLWTRCLRVSKSLGATLY